MSMRPTRVEGHPARVEPDTRTLAHAAPAAGAETGQAATAPSDEPSAAVARRRLSIEQTGSYYRRLPKAGQINRRRRMLRWTKWVLPAGALLLLASIAAWPEIDRAMNSARLGLKRAEHIRMDSGHMIGASYRGLDGHGRPYMITADEAQQAAVNQAGSAGGDRVNLLHPIADTLTQGGSWIRISAEDGVYMQHSQLLDLSRDVLLYRNDGIMMTGPLADVDLKRGVIAMPDWVHAEGPFGILDAQGALMSQRDGIGQFRGPGRLVLNDDRVARPTMPAPVPGAVP